jgi:Family of unknown function (DUF6125)
MTPGTVTDVAALSREELIRFVGILAGKALVHYGLWFSQAVRHQDLDTGLAVESEVIQGYGPVVLKRLAPHLGIEMEGDIPRVLMSKTNEELVALLQDIARTWLTADALWLQALESRFDAGRAKLVNDFCWSTFARMEAFKIREFLELPPRGGLKALEKALQFRIYSCIIDYEVSWENENTLIWKILGCRVQNMGRQKGMDFYPCKSAGVVEYSRFAQGIDPAIRTECVTCPPDPAPEEVICAWKFTVR